MSENKKVEQIEQEAKEDKAPELSDQDLDNVAGGGASSVNTSRSNIKNN